MFNKLHTSVIALFGFGGEDTSVAGVPRGWIERLRLGGAKSTRFWMLELLDSVPGLIRLVCCTRARSRFALHLTDRDSRELSNTDWLLSCVAHYTLRMIIHNEVNMFTLYSRGSCRRLAFRPSSCSQTCSPSVPNRRTICHLTPSAIEAASQTDSQSVS